MSQTPQGETWAEAEGSARRVVDFARKALLEFGKRVILGGLIIGLGITLVSFKALETFFWVYCASEIIWVQPEGGGWICDPELAINVALYFWIPALALVILPPWPGRPLRRLAVYAGAILAAWFVLAIWGVITPSGFPDADTIRELQRSVTTTPLPAN